jgi:hypothetical protein
MESSESNNSAPKSIAITEVRKLAEAIREKQPPKDLNKPEKSRRS